MRRFWVGCVVLLSAVGCGGKSSADGNGTASTKATVVKDEGYSHACATDDDCVLAEFGDACGICNFSNAAIAKSAEASWQQALNTARNNCPPNGPVGKCAARYGVSSCQAKVCTYVECKQRAVDEHHCAAAADGGR